MASLQKTLVIKKDQQIEQMFKNAGKETRLLQGYKRIRLILAIIVDSAFVIPALFNNRTIPNMMATAALCLGANFLCDLMVRKAIRFVASANDVVINANFESQSTLDIQAVVEQKIKEANMVGVPLQRLEDDGQNLVIVFDVHDELS